jgi:hypothetical protein
VNNFFPSSERKEKKEKKREKKIRKPTLKMDTWYSESTDFLVQKAKQKKYNKNIRNWRGLKNTIMLEVRTCWGEAT